MKLYCKKRSALALLEIFTHSVKYTLGKFALLSSVEILYWSVILNVQMSSLLSSRFIQAATCHHAVRTISSESILIDNVSHFNPLGLTAFA